MVIKYQKTPTSDKAWDGGANEKNLKQGQDAAYYEKMYTWVDEKKDSTTKSAYKFPHHEVSNDGDICDANIKACQSIIAILNGGMGGADIPSADKQGVYDHVSHHLKDADVEPAKLKRNKPLKGSQEMRAFSMPDLTAEPEGNVIDGHAAVFGQVVNMFDCWNETIARGAFDKANFNDVLFSVNHDLSVIPLARSRNNNANSTLQLKVDDQGLYTRAALDIDNNGDAKALYGSVQRGDMNGMSFIFSVRTDEWTGLDTSMPSRTITDIAKVYEVSAVSFPAYDGTDINARSEQELDSFKKMLDSVRAEKEPDGSEQREKEQKEQQSTFEIEKLKAEILLKL